MNKLNFEPGDCSKVRDLVDAYLSDELLVETNQQILSHLNTCERCVAIVEDRKRVRHLLRRAVDNQQIPAGLEQKIKLGLRQQNHGRMNLNGWRALAIAATLAVAALGGWAVFHLAGHSPVIAAFNLVHVVSQQGLAVLDIGVQDHIKCAINHHTQDQKFTQEMMFESLGPEYSGLVNLIKHKIPGNYSMTVGHRCTIKGREYVHFILRDGDHAISIVFTKKHDETLASSDGKTAQISKETIYESRLQGYDVASFESHEYLGFVVSDTGETNTVQLASDLASTVKDFLSKSTN